MILLAEYEDKTERGTPCRVQIEQNHHGAFEAHVFIRSAPAGAIRIFASYDQEERTKAERLAFERAAVEGF